MADPNTPTWLQESNQGGGTAPEPGAPTSVAPPPAPAAGSTTASSSRNNNNNNSTSMDADITADDPDLPGVILTMRLANMGVAVALIVVAILELVDSPAISSLILALYACCGGVLICALETQLKFLRVMIAINFGFLFQSAWRFLFYLLLGSIAWTFGALGQGVGIAFIAVAFYNTYVLCRYPSYRRMREKIAEEEDRRIEARISKEVKRQAARQIMKS